MNPGLSSIPAEPAVCRLAFIFLSTLLLSWLLSSLLITPLAAKTKPSTPLGTDRDYISALATANRFLHAWRSQDHEAGLVMLTDAAKHRTSEGRLLAFFSPPAATHQAFEISSGKKLKDGRYSFPIALFEIAPGHGRTHPRFSEIIVIRTGKDDWAIDKLP